MHSNITLFIGRLKYFFVLKNGFCLATNNKLNIFRHYFISKNKNMNNFLSDFLSNETIILLDSKQSEQVTGGNDPFRADMDIDGSSMHILS